MLPSPDLISDAAVATAAPALLKQGAEEERERLRGVLTDLVRNFRTEADQRDGEAAAHSDRVEEARLRSSSAAWRTAADALERAALTDNQESS